MNETPHIGMDQLSYFVGMMKHYLDPNREERFWDRIRENCPDLMQAIEASFKHEYGWDEITFTRNIFSPAFDPTLIEAYQEEPHNEDQEKTMNPHTEAVKRGAALLDKEHPGWRDEIDLTTLDLSDDCYCVLGQVFGTYYDGLSVLWNTDVDAPHNNEWLDSDDFQIAASHGFSIDLPFRPHKWRLLQEAWIAELSENLQQRQQLPAQLEPEQESRI